MDSEKINPRLGAFLILIAIGLIVGASYVIISEVLEAKKECNLIDGKYNFKIIKGHFCNERSFVKYNHCFQGRGCDLIWVFEDSFGKINMSEVIK